MSRIGIQTIQLPDHTTVEETADMLLTVKGPKGTLQIRRPEGLTVLSQENVLTIERASEEHKAAHGLLRALLYNAVVGVSSGWQRNLEMNGVGMRAAVSGRNLTLNVGFSHPVLFEAPDGIDLSVAKNVITVSGIDKQAVGEIAAQIRKIKPPEPYKGKGIKFSDEQIRRKAGKTGKGK
jgi:large subunit ribosomal protein L6